MQAMATGLPVVTTAAGAIPELVRDSETGLVVPTENVDALSDAIARLLADKELADRLGSAGSALIAKSFTSDSMLDRMEEILIKAASGAR
jgi:phosphatidylinositol alpha-1,6-mannosyltransferase